MTIIMSVPPQMAGVISGLAQMVYQVSTVPRWSSAKHACVLYRLIVASSSIPLPTMYLYRTDCSCPLLTSHRQVGAVTGLSIQAGLLTVHPGDVSNWSNIQTSYWFDFGWALVCGALVLVLYRDVQGSGGEEQVEAGSVELGKAGGEVEAH